MQEQETTGKPDGVVASLDRVDGERRFVVRNLGESIAREVDFSVDSEREKNPPVSRGDLERVFPVTELEPRKGVSVAAIITPGTGLRFRGVVSWKEPDGSTRESVFYMSA